MADPVGRHALDVRSGADGRRTTAKKNLRLVETRTFNDGIRVLVYRGRRSRRKHGLLDEVAMFLPDRQ